MTLRPNSLLLLMLITLICQISACSNGIDIRKQKAAQDSWLEKNFPDEKHEPPEQAALQTEFYNDVIEGNVVVGMNLLETMVATKTQPHGNNKYTPIFWCDGQPINACHNDCHMCAAVLITDKINYYLKGKGTNPRVVQQLPKQAEDTAQNFKSKSFSVINALFLNNIVAGMNVADFNRIRLLPTAKQQYYCNNRRIYDSCLGNCGDCIIRILTPRGDKTHVQTVHFKGHMGFKSIVNVTESTQSATEPTAP